MEESQATEICWRKEVDQNLKRLHSLLFGIDRALERKDFSSAQILSLRLLGFLDSRTRDKTDECFISPIRREVTAKLDIARRSLAAESDRLVFQQVRRDPGRVFVKKGEIDIEKIKQSKYFKTLCRSSKGNSLDMSGLHPLMHVDSNGTQGTRTRERLHLSQAGQHDRQNDRFSCKTSKVMTQAKLTSLYGSKLLKPNSNLNFLNPKSEYDVKERTQAYNQNIHKNQGVFPSVKVEDEEKPQEYSSTTSRAHLGICSPKNENMKSPSCGEETDAPGNAFVTARTKLEIDARQRRGLAGSPSAQMSPQNDNSMNSRGYGMRSGGFPRRGVRNNFVPPIRSNGSNTGNLTSRISGKGDDSLDDSTKRCLDILCGPDGELPEKLRNLEPRLLEHVSNEIMDRDPDVRWDDIAGLEHAKKCVTEMVVWPLLRPDIFKGCRSPGKGLLLFGPPGTGKTMIGKAIAGEAKATFFYISASSLTKQIGEGEKLVRALFGVASCRQPAVIFVDEIDSLLSQRKSEGEHESSRRLKTQFLIEMEGFDTASDQILLIGATNRPQELDEAARRRLTKRLYIPLPSLEARAWIIRSILRKDGLLGLSDEEINSICTLTEGYSGSDMKNLVEDAAMGPVREAAFKGMDITSFKQEELREIGFQDFKNSLQEVRPSVSANELGAYEEWNKQFGSLSL